MRNVENVCHRMFDAHPSLCILFYQETVSYKQTLRRYGRYGYGRYGYGGYGYGYYGEKQKDS